MSKKHHLHYVLVADSSSSMADQIDEVRDELNIQIEKMRKESDTDNNPCTFTLRTFDSEVKNVHVNIPIEDVPKITTDDYKAGGMTALFDAIGSTIESIGELLGNRIDGEKETLAMIIFSDGGENVSTKYDRAKIAALLDKYQNRPGFNIAFVGCDPASFQDMDRVGFSSASRMMYSKGEEREALANASRSVSDLKFKRTTKFDFKL
ncbi:MAG: hypothetical protein ACKVJY_04840 [Flavobacteriales bacterium]|tara:strand:- start:819 stop:1439 length:621 start_codon:yes stop_codon:yes gene_type:complete